MNTVYVKGYWKSVEDLTFQQLREMLDAAEADFRSEGATEVFVDEVDREDGTIFLQGTRPRTAEEEAEAESISAMTRDGAVKRHIESIERITGKEVKLV